MKDKMIFFEKSKIFNEKMYEIKPFSTNEIESLKNHGTLKKMFSVMDMETTLKVFKSPFANLISNIIYQQVAFKVARYSEVMLFDYLNYDITPETILSVTDKQFKQFKITGRRIEYMRNFSNFVIENEEFFNNILNKSSEEIYDTLITIPGVGKWTIEMFMLFGLGKSDILSYGDLIIVNGLKDLYGEVDKKKFEDIYNEITDFATITSINLWKYMEQGYYKQRKN